MQARPRRPPVQPTAKMIHFPASTGGLNSIDGGSTMASTDGTLIYNMVAGQYGLRVRPGYTTSDPIGGGTELRSIFPFNGSKADASTDKLFAVIADGIYDFVAGVATHVATYGTTTGDAGYGTCVAFNTSADRYLVATDEVNGYWLYKESTNAWAQIAMGGGGTQISGVDPATFCHVTVFKNRLWFTQKNSTLAWYLGTNAVYGAATSFDFGARFAHGGDLRGLYNWSYDGGSGIDTLLCALSGGGDVAIYQGTDPTTAAGFSLKGTWYVGGVPAGRRIATDYGGDLLVLSTLGVIPLSRLVVGTTIPDVTQYSTYKITNIFAKAMASYGSNKGWTLRVNPNDSSLLINVPNGGSTVAFQFVMSLATKAWSQYGHDTSTTCIGYPALCCESWHNVLYFGDNVGSLHLLTPLSSTTQLDGGSVPIEYQAITAFQDLGAPTNKTVSEIRPRFLTYMNQTTAGFSGMFGASARFDYDTTELTANSSLVVPAATSTPTTYRPIFGATGLGTSVAVGVRGKSSRQTTLIGFDVLYQEGGFQ